MHAEFVVGFLSYELRQRIRRRIRKDDTLRSKVFRSYSTY
jgi:anti-sigma-K factor RskA